MTPISAGRPTRMTWSLAAQLRLAFGTALLMTLGVVTGAWWGVLGYEHEINRAYETQLRTTVQLAEAQSAFWELRYDLRQFMNESREGQQQILEKQDRLYAVVEERLAAYDQTASSTEERRTLTHLRSAYQRYRQARPKFFELWQAGEKDDAIAWITLATAPFGEAAAREFEAQIALQQSYVNMDRDRSERKARLALGLVTALTVALLAMLVTGYAYSLRVLRPIIALRDETQRVMREQLGETIAAPASSNEVAALKDSFVSIFERLREHTESLRHAHERLEFLMGATPAIIYSGQAHGDHAVTFASANVRDVLGYEAGEFLRDSRLWPSNIHPDDHARVFAPRASPTRTGGYIREYRFRHKDGSWRWLHDEFTLIRDATGARQEVIGCCLDVTELVQRTAITELLEALSRIANEAGTPEEALRRCLERISEHGGWSLSHVAVFAAGRSAEASVSANYWHPATPGRFSEFMRVSDGTQYAAGRRPFVARVLREKQPVWLADLTRFSGSPRLGPGVAAGLRSAFALPVIVGGDVAAILEFFSSEVREPDRVLLDAINTVASQLARLIERDRAATLQRAQNDELARRNVMVTEALRAKTEFLNNVTHELRTPLNSVIGFAELLKDEVPGPLNPKQAQFTADILASGERLLALVEGILEMSRLDGADAALEREPVEIGAALEARVAAHRKAVQARGIAVQVDVAPDACRAELDPKALRRMLDTLVSNAIKFNRDGGTVAVSARRENGALEIAVTDTGIGIAHADLAKLFKPLVQLDAGLARKHGGVGLGLALARRLAELHGGTIEVESEPGKGSTFTLRLSIVGDA